jgi:hypothetical protein
MKKITWVTISASLLASLGAKSESLKQDVSASNHTSLNQIQSNDSTSKALNNVNLDEIPEHKGSEPCVGSTNGK